MLLYNLTIDALSQILDQFEIADLCRLHTTCIPLHRMLISTSIVKRVRVTAKHRDYALPSLLYQLHGLVDVFLGSKGVIETLRLPTGVKHPCQFGPSVRTLQVSGTLATQYLLTAEDTDPCENFLSRRVPNLEKFSLDFWSDVENASGIVEGLPSTLTSLYMNYHGFPTPKGPFPSINHLPHLTDIAIHYCFDAGDSGNFTLVHCQNLTSVHMNGLPNDVVLPKTIEKANLPTLNRFWSASLEKVSELSLYNLIAPFEIPKSVVSLSLEVIPNMEAVLTALPSTLAHLKVVKWTGTYDLSLLCLLPVGLKTLQISSRVRYPPFETFKGALQARCDGNKLRWLPPHLETFHINPLFSPTISREYWALLPPTITDLAPALSVERAVGESSLPDFSIDLASQLPLIQSLTLQGDPEALLDYSARHLVLPSKLTTLILTHPQHPEGLAPSFVSTSIFDMNVLPQSLTSFRLEDRTLPESLANLPAGLRSLHCVFASHMDGISSPKGSSLGQLNLTFVSKTFADSLKALPSRLEYLQLAMKLLIPATTELIQSLPRDLITLHIKSLYKLEDKHIPHLPPSLTRLVVNHCENVSDASVSMMPPRIRVLMLKGNRALTPSSWPNFPPGLKKLYIPKNRNFPKSLFASFVNDSKNIKTKKLHVHTTPKRR